MAPKQLRIGMVGCGRMARHHVSEIAATRGLTVVALCDSNRDRREQLRNELAPRAQTFASLDAMLKAELDAVVVCTPNNLHCPMSLKALKAGLHVLCEKPLAGTVADATRIVQAARRARRVLHVNQSLRYNAQYQTVANLVHQGRIGEPIHVRCIRASGRTPDKGWSPGATWFVSKKSQGGIINDIAIHNADLLRWLCGDVAKIAATVDIRTPGIDAPDDVTALFRFSSGATGILTVSWALPSGGGGLEVYGTKGRIRMGYSEEPIELIRITAKGPTTTYPALKKRVPSSHAAFVNAVNGKAPSPTPGELGRDAVAICEAIAQAGKSGCFVKVRKFGPRTT